MAVPRTTEEQVTGVEKVWPEVTNTTGHGWSSTILTTTESTVSKDHKEDIFEFNPVNVDYLDEKCEELLLRGLATKENDKIVIDVTANRLQQSAWKGKDQQTINNKIPTVLSISSQKN